MPINQRLEMLNRL